MYIQSKKITKLSLSLLVAINLVACGGGGDSTDSAGENSGSQTADNCVTFPLPQVGIKTTTQEEIFGTNQAITQTIKTITAKTRTKISSKSNHRHSKGILSFEDRKTSTIEFLIADNYMDIAKSTSRTETVNLLTNASARNPNDAPTTPTNEPPVLAPPEDAEDDGIVNSKKTFSSTTGNPNLEAVNKVCEGQSWTTSYIVKDNQTNGAGQLIRNVTQAVDKIFTVESINKPQTVAAGTFNTYQLKIEDGSTVTTQWVDTKTGVLVKSDKRLTDGTRLESTELQKTERVLLSPTIPTTPTDTTNTL